MVPLYKLPLYAAMVSFVYTAFCDWNLVGLVIGL